MDTTGAPTPNRPSNGQIAALLREFADLSELRGESAFRTRAYRRAADRLETLDHPVAAWHAERLQTIEGIGKGISAAVAEIVARGAFRALDEARAVVPASVIRFTALPGVGAKTAARLYEALGVTTLDELRAAAEGGGIARTKGLGARVERTVLAGLAELAASDGRTPLGVALPRATLLRQLLHQRLSIPVELAGSVRRRAETVGDIDLLAAADAAAPVLDAFAALPPVREVLERTADSARVALDGELTAQLGVVPAARYGTELVRWTGSRAHLDELRALAGGDPFTAAHADEAAFYAALDLPPIPPELREGWGEVAAARAGRLPRPIEAGDLRGDLHAHSTWSDGSGTIAEMARAALARGYAYLSISDHTHGLGIANGLDEQRLRAQWREIERLNAELAPFHLLRSAEVEIRADGSLDLPDAVLAELDIVVASLHSGRRGDRATVTGRLLAAIRNPHVDIIAHPTGRIVGGRAGADYDWDAVFGAAVEAGTALEINASPERLDLRDELAHQALERGIPLTIGSDAHGAEGLALIGYGVAVARRARATAGGVLNTRPLDELLAWARDR